MKGERSTHSLSDLHFYFFFLHLLHLFALPYDSPDEAHVGKYVNAYLTKQFTFDTHPPLGKMLLAGISKIGANYSGMFPFDDVNE